MAKNFSPMEEVEQVEDSDLINRETRRPSWTTSFIRMEAEVTHKLRRSTRCHWAETIRQLEDVDLMKEIPLVKVLTKTEEPDDAVRDQKNDAFAALHEEDMKRFSTRLDDLRKNKPKAYALIFADFCSSSMQIRIKEHPK
eukprot:scaffold6888_cov96-Cylindrotheca_fusiformis.AAC.4